MQKQPAFVYEGDDDALAVHLGISRREIFVSLQNKFFTAWATLS
jgi:hypothetical protein